MQAIVHQLGELFLQAVPTVLIILLFYFILRALFFKPLLAVTAERDSRTAGAEKAAEAGEVSAAKARAAAELAAACRDVEATVAELSAEIARRILETPPRPGAPLRE